MNSNNNCNTTEKQLQTVHPAITFLYSLGYKDGDIVSGRCLSKTKGKDKNHDWFATLSSNGLDLYEYHWIPTGEIKKDGKQKYKAIREKREDKHHPDGLAWLAKINETEHSQIYFNVNGGRSKAEVESAYACFFESDTGSFDEQWKIIQSLCIKPTAVVQTRKSLHVYFALADKALAEWIARQKRIILATKSDPAIKNIDRLMRLPGFYHWKEIDGNWDKVLCKLEVCDSENIYHSEDIDDAVAELSTCEYSEKRFRLYQFLTAKLNNRQGQDYSLINIDDVFTTSEEGFDNYNLRAREYCRRVLRAFKGRETAEPALAFTDSLTKVKKVAVDSRIKKIKAPSDANLNTGGATTLNDYFASKYAVGYDGDGRSEWATCQCPVHGGPGHSFDSLHIHRQTGGMICHHGCDVSDIIDELRELAKDANDPAWNWDRLPSEELELDPLKLELRYGEPIELVPMTDAEREAFQKRQDEARQKEFEEWKEQERAKALEEGMAILNAELPQLDVYRTTRTRLHSIIISNHSDHKNKSPLFTLNKYFHEDVLYELLDTIQRDARVCLDNLEKPQLHKLLRTYGYKGMSNFGKSDLLGGPNPQKRIKDKDGKWQDVWTTNELGERIPEPKYSEGEWAKVQEFVTALKEIDLNKHLDLFPQDKFINVDLLIDHPHQEYIAHLVNVRYNQHVNQTTYTCHFRLNKFKERPFVSQREWEQNAKESLEARHKKVYFEEWQRLTDFTADITDEADFIGSSEVFTGINILDGNVHLLSGGLGGGKTTDLINKLVHLIVNVVTAPSGNPLKILCCSHRLNLIANTMFKLKTALVEAFKDKQQVDEQEAEKLVNEIVFDAESFKKAWGNFFNKWSDKNGKPLVIFTCTDSLPAVAQKLPESFRQDSVVIFDELDAVLKHTVLGSTCKNKRPLIFDSLELLFAESLGVYCLSGTLNEVCKDLFAGIGKAIKTYKNTKIKARQPINYTLGVGDFNEKTERLYFEQMKRSFILDQIFDALRKGENILIASDSKNWNEILEELIKTHVSNLDVSKMCRIDSIEKVSKHDARRNMVNAIMSNPGQAIVDEKLRCVIYNSSAESGVDVTMPAGYKNYFSKIFCFNFGVIGVAGIIQLLKRYRERAEITLWSVPGRSGDTDYPEIPNHRVRQYKDELRHIEGELDKEREWKLDKFQQHQEKYYRIANDLRFIDAVERRHPRLCLEFALEKHGYDLNYSYGTDTGTTMSEERKLVRQRLVNDILTADRKYVDCDDLDTISQNVTSELDIRALQLAFYAKRLGYDRVAMASGEATLLNAELIETCEYDERSFFDHCKNRIYANLSDEQLRLLHPVSKGHTFIKDVKLVLAPHQFIQKSGIGELVKISLTKIGEEKLIDKLELLMDDERIAKIKSWASDKRNQEKWKVLSGSTMIKASGEIAGDKAFVYQLKSILRSYFGIVCKVKNGKMTLIFSDLQNKVIPQLWKGTDDRIFRAMVHLNYDTDGDRYPEVVNDPRYKTERARLDYEFECNTEYVDYSEVTVPVAQPESTEVSQTATVSLDTPEVTKETATTEANNQPTITSVPMLPVSVKLTSDTVSTTTKELIRINDLLPFDCYEKVTEAVFVTGPVHDLTTADVSYFGEYYQPSEIYKDGIETSIIYRSGNNNHIAIRYLQSASGLLIDGKRITNIHTTLKSNWWQF